MYGWRGFVSCCETVEEMEGSMVKKTAGGYLEYVLVKKGVYRCKEGGEVDGSCEKCLFRQRVLPGSHFYFKEKPELVWGVIEEEVGRIELGLKG